MSTKLTASIIPRTREGSVMRYELAIFDLDGTVLDTLDDLTDSINCALERSAFPKRTKDEVRSFIGNGIKRLCESAISREATREDVDRVFFDFNEHYAVHCHDKTRPYNGICDMISRLREAGIHTAVVSNKADYAVQELVSRYFPNSFDVVTGERADFEKKPAPDLVEAVIKKIGVPKERTVYIGDSEVDVATAKNASIDLIAVDWGFRSASYLEKAGAGKIVSTVEELRKKLLK